ncbi:MAG: response regulator transcription factor [Planctomycetes bacterium]|nr:response regulator transcription factor [Planctomycetota bacterium]
MNAPDRPISVFLIDDQAMIRAAFRSLLEEQAGIQVVGDSGDARTAIAEVEELRPDIVLLDITMPGLSGIDAIPLLRKASKNTRIVMLTHHEGETFVEQSLKAGAQGYLSKDSEPGELVIALKSAMQGHSFLSPKVASGLVARARGGAAEGPAPSSRIEQLTPREREVFQLLALGHSNKEVARDLNMSLGTAKKHRENLQRKLDCHSPAELARLAIREGLLEG